MGARYGGIAIFGDGGVADQGAKKSGVTRNVISDGPGEHVGHVSVARRG